MLNRISLRQMEYFVATAECGSIIAASEKIHVSSPSISTAIGHIESELRVRLFIRQHAKGLQLTSVGEQVLAACKNILSLAGGLYSIASEHSGIIQGPLRLGCFSAFAPMVYAEIVYGFTRLHPRVQLAFCEDNHQTLMKKLAARELDVALTYDLAIDTAAVQFEPLAALPPYVLVSERHELATRTSVAVEELVSFPMVLLDMPYSNDYFISLFRCRDVEPDIRFASPSTEMVRSMVANGLGFTILNVRPKSDYSADGRKLVRVRLSGENRSLRLGLAAARNTDQGHVAEVFMSRCRVHISDQYIPGMGAPSYFDPRPLAAADPQAEL